MSTNSSTQEELSRAPDEPGHIPIKSNYFKAFGVRINYVDEGSGYREGQRIGAMVPDGRFQLVPDARHYLQEDAGKEIAGRMISFLKDEAKISDSN